MARLKSPLAAAAIGGGVTAGSLLGTTYGLDPATAAGTWKETVISNRAKISWGLGLVASGIVYALTKDKELAISSAIGSTAAGIVPVVLEVHSQMSSAPGLPASRGTGFGIAVAERVGFGAPPNVQLFGAPPNDVKLLGTASQASRQASYSPAAFGGGSF